jgi:hypothetical protein
MKAGIGRIVEAVKDEKKLAVTSTDKKCCQKY